MQSIIKCVGLLGSLGLLVGFAACSAEDDGRIDDDRGTWQSAGKADDGATCAGSCGDQSAAGCWCDDQCESYGDCCPDKRMVCDGGGDEPPPGGDDGNGDEPPPGGDDGSGDTLCFPGASGDNSACVGLVPASAVGSGYNYPSPLSGNANYRKPIMYIDLEAAGSSLKIAPNFTLGEVAQSWKGRYAVVQPHAIRHLQDLRNQVGAIQVNSGYRSPSYNASVDGATHSRHMYGDAFDLKPLSVGLSTLESACTSHGGKLVEYSSHVHCDWRYDTVDPQLYGAAAVIGGAEPFVFTAADGYSASLEHEDGLWTAPATGFDEGEPMRRWTALDADGEVIGQSTGQTFASPLGTATVEVVVGAQLELSADL